MYDRQNAHWRKWFSTNKYLRLVDIKRNSLQDYALTKTEAGYELNTAKLEVTYIRMWWKWLQETEKVGRLISVNRLKPAIENRTS